MSDQLLSDKPIAQGRTAEIYAWQRGQILKLYRTWCPSNWADWEARLTRAITAAGVPAPAAIDVVEYAGRHGVIFERITGPSLLADFVARPWRLIWSAHLLADLQAAMHARTLTDLPDLRESLQQRITDAPVTDAIKLAALATLAQLPDGQAICHGDFHPDNVVLTARGPVILDWMTAARGHPLADVARTGLILRLGNPPPGPGRRLFQVARSLFYTQYLRRYQQLRHVTRAEIEAWQLPVAVARTCEKIPDEQQSLAAIIDVSIKS